MHADVALETGVPTAAPGPSGQRRPPIVIGEGPDLVGVMAEPTRVVPDLVGVIARPARPLTVVQCDGW